MLEYDTESGTIGGVAGMEIGGGRETILRVDAATVSDGDVRWCCASGVKEDTGDPHHEPEACDVADIGVSASLGVVAVTKESSSARLGDDDLVGA